MKKLKFKSDDGLEITADYYKRINPKGFILLCHRSHCNRAEYRETATKFNKLGYSCLAIDQRSGMDVFGEKNETKNRAKKLLIPTGYLDAKIDIESAIKYAYKLNNNNRIILLGSSYSAALSLLIAKESNKIKSLILFSPAEHIKNINISGQIKNINIPIFATSAKREIQDVSNILKFIDKNLITHFKPIAEGFHGSKILWEVVKGYELCWNMLESFLNLNNND